MKIMQQKQTKKSDGNSIKKQSAPARIRASRK
jgi:hypothetical protein